MGGACRAWIAAALVLIAPWVAVAARAAGGDAPTASGGPPPSRLERIYADRAGEPLRLFGHDLFAAGTGAEGPVLGAVQDDHVLGIGDSLQVTLRGQVSDSRTYPIAGDGTLTLDRLRPIQAAGRTLGDIRREIAASVSAAHLQTEAFVTLAAVRRVSVLVVGEVARQGRHDLSAFATVLDALFAAGGVRPGGSLRAIRLLRPGAPAETVDLYDLIAGTGDAAAIRLTEGARIVVPPLGATVAAAGGVRRPGIFELRPGTAGMDKAELLALAGGPLRPGPQRSVRLGFGRDGAEAAHPIPAGTTASFGDGDILLYATARMDRTATVELLGQVRDPGPRPVRAGQRLAALLAAPDLADDAYRPLAALARRTPGTGAVGYDAVDLAAVLGGREGPALAAGDALIVLGSEDIAYLASGPVLAVLAGRDGATADCAGLAALAASLAADPRGSLAAGPLAKAAAGLTGPPLPCPATFAEHPDLLPWLLGRSVLLRRGVLRPGPYPAVPGADPAGLVAAAGGRVDGPLEIVSGPGDARVVDAAPAGVELTGAVLLPGVRPLSAAGSLRALLDDGRALTADAYPLFAAIERFDPADLRTVLLPVSPLAVIRGGTDWHLQDRDRVHILDRRDLAELWREPPEEGASQPAATVADSAAAPPQGAAAAAPPRDPPDESLLRLAREHQVRLSGAVYGEGAYPVAGDTALTDLIAAGGGMTPTADPTGVEVTIAQVGGGGLRALVADLALHTVRAGDAVRVPPQARSTDPGRVRVSGEVMRPGWYDLLPGERLSSVLERAGGLTPQAYAYGTVFTRVSARLAEEAGLRRASAELDRGLALALLRSDPPDGARVELVRQLSGALRETPGFGRITVEADPEVLAVKTRLDILMESGDRVHVPKRPLTVTVSGEVLSPASLQYVRGKSLNTYIREAGGLSASADSARIFVLLPNGSAQTARSGPGRGRLRDIPPGAIIVVPRDPEPFEFLPTVQSIATILGQLAIATVGLTVVTGE